MFLSNRICQENFFGEQRQRGRVNENPNARDFIKNTQALRVINGSSHNVKTGNCRGRKESKLIDDINHAPLSKRRKARK